MLRGMRMSVDQIVHAILSVDDSVLTAIQLEMLARYTPEEDEIEAVQAYRRIPQGGILGEAEEYIFAISDIPFIGARLEAMRFRLEVSSELDEIIPDLESVEVSPHFAVLMNFASLHTIDCMPAGVPIGKVADSAFFDSRNWEFPKRPQLSRIRVWLQAGFPGPPQGNTCHWGRQTLPKSIALYHPRARVYK